MASTMDVRVAALWSMIAFVGAAIVVASTGCTATAPSPSRQEAQVEDDGATRRLEVDLTDDDLPCGVGRVKEGAAWNEPYRYVFLSYPDYLEDCQYIFMRQVGGGAVGRWFETGQVAVSKECWLYAAVHKPTDDQRMIWQQEGWEMLPDVLKDLGDPRRKPRPEREYALMCRRIPAGPVCFDTEASEAQMVIWFFKDTGSVR